MHPTSLTVDVAVIRAHVDDLSRRSTGIVDDGRSQLRGPRSSLPARPGYRIRWLTRHTWSGEPSGRERAS